MYFAALSVTLNLVVVSLGVRYLFSQQWDAGWLACVCGLLNVFVILMFAGHISHDR